MNVLHGVLLSGSGLSNEDPLFLWLEPDTGRTREAAQGQQHPYALPPQRAVQELRIFQPDLALYGCTYALLLPTDEQGPTMWPHAESEQLLLREWSVGGARLHHSALVPFLKRVMAHQDDHGGIKVAPDLKAIARFAAWVLRQVDRGRVVPDIEYEGRGLVRALWRLAPDGTTREALDYFAALLPGAAISGTRQMIDELTGSPRDVRRDALLAFGDLLVDQAVRERIAGVHPVMNVRQHGRLIERWVTALQSEDPMFSASSAIQNLVEAVKRWHAVGSMADHDDRPIRLILQLAPELEQSESRGGVRLPKGWYLGYALYEPESTEPVPAADVWERKPDAHTLALQGQLRRLLAQVGRHFEPILRSLAEPSPQGCQLSWREAAHFIDEVSDLLHAQGVVIQLPAWMERSPVPVRTRVVVEPGEGQFGLDTLVSYSWQVSVGDVDIDPEAFDRLTEAVLPFVQLNGDWVVLNPEELRRLVERRTRPESRRNTVAQLVADSLAWDDATEVAIEGEHNIAPMRELLDALGKARRWEVLDPPKGLKAELRPYQARGFSWLAFMRQYRLGACLADDMGLGKTLQVIALLQHEKEQGRLGRTLVVCPTSVVENWRRELERFAPSLRVYVHHGKDRPHGDAFVRRTEEVDVVVTTYGLVHRDRDALQGVAWDTVVADEAQNLKNPLAKQTRSLKSLTASHCIALTGTPLENRLLELWSIFDFINPGYLGSLTAFRQDVETPIARYGDERVLDWLRRRIGPFILRRAKSDPDIAPELPEKLESKVYCYLTPEQAALYQAVVEQMMRRIEEAAGMKRRGLVLASLTRLKQICNHPALFHKEPTADPKRSGKLARLIEMLQEVRAEGASALIFTQYAQMGHLLQAALTKSFGEKTLFLHGGVPRSERDKMVRIFQNGDAPLFILSLRAGGVGLNLTRATHVFHFDRWWNPAVENQATDRAYRIGQASQVHVHKLICTGTLEDRIDELIDGKRTMAEEVLKGGEQWLSELSNEALRELITLQSEVPAP